MKNFLLLLIGCFIILTPFYVKAQSAPTFTVLADTITYTINNIGTTPSPYDKPVTNTTAPGGLTLRWHVLASNFPADWRTSGALGICDNQQCYQNAGDTGLWNNHGSGPYLYNTPGQFDLSLNFSPVSIGTYYITVALTDVAGAYTKDITYIITKAPTAVPVISNVEDKVTLYPNPANDEINVVYDANADVKNIAVYNIIGKVMTVYKVTGDSANLNIENIPSGIYFVRLFNSNGNVVVTRKFTKQ